MDPEEKKITTDGERLRLMTEHEGWAVARSLLSEKILELQMIGDLVGLPPERMALMLEAKNLAKTFLFDFLNEIEGNVEQHINNNQKKEPKESYIFKEE